MTMHAVTNEEQRLSSSQTTELQRRLQAAESALAQARAAREIAVRSKADFIASVSHELRTPLQSIIGFSELGASMAQSRSGQSGHAEYGDMFNDICAGGQRMLSLVNVLLDVASLSSSIGSLSLQRVDLIELIECVLVATHSQTFIETLHVSFDHTADPVWALANASRMQQVLSNVLSNARKFGASTGSTQIEIECKTRADESIEISVRDHGPGIPSDELDAIFEPFVQSSRTREGSNRMGMGLGLTLCRKIMAAHGGSIEGFNAQGGGSLFRILLPADVGLSTTAL
jgi:signal transduction histidine kinase